MDTAGFSTRQVWKRKSLTCPNISPQADARQNMAQPVSYATYLEWDSTTWGQALRFWVDRSSVPLDGAHILEIGSRDGGLSLWLAEMGADVVCSDLGGPSKKAKALHASSPIAGTIHYMDLDALKLDVEATYDIVIFKSVLGGIGGAHGAGGQRAALENMHRALRPGGSLLFAENLIGSRLICALRKRFVQWGGRWRYVSTTELSAWLSPFENVEFRQFGTFALLGRTERQRHGLALADKTVLDRVTPKGWRYVVAGCARKASV
jgi:SAM-dependent methyltransferase